MTELSKEQCHSLSEGLIEERDMYKSCVGHDSMLSTTDESALGAFPSPGLFPHAARAMSSFSSTLCRSSGGLWAPVVGSWFVQVAFSATHSQVSSKIRGKTENTVFTFVPGGGLVVSGPFSTTAAGHWQLNSDGTYTFVVAEFVFDPVTLGIMRVIVPNASFKLDSSLNHLVVTSGVTTVYIYDPMNGKLLESFQVIIDPDDPNPPERVTGQRITPGWIPPNPILPK